MTGAGLHLEFSEELKLSFLALRDAVGARAELLDIIGGLVEDQTRRRFLTEKSGPDGAAWLPWSGPYAATRHGNQSLLIDTGRMEKSITHNIYADEVHIGTNLIYGATHQFGSKKIPARPFLGLSQDNVDEIQSVVDEYFTAALNG
jgi:phage virion morphogenesis protein